MMENHASYGPPGLGMSENDSFSALCLLLLKFKKNPFPFAKVDSCPCGSPVPCSLLLFPACLFGRSKWTQPRAAAALFVHLVDFAHVHSRDVRSEGRLPSELQKSLFCPSLRSCGAPALSLTGKRSLAYCGSPLCCFYDPHHFALALKSDVTGKQVEGRFDRAARFLRRINLQRSTTTCHVLVLKGLAT